MNKAAQLVQAQSRLYQKIAFGSEARDKLLYGAKLLADAVRSTMGPSGHNVIIDNDLAAPTITKDGVTVAKAINLKDKLPAVGAELLKEVASKTNELAGDGTTTATILAYEMLAQGIKMITTGVDAIALKRGMDMATAKVIDWLRANAISVRDEQDIISVGTISANGDRQVGELLARAISKVGQDGIITIEPAKSVQTTLDVVEGMQFDNGYTSPYFVTNQEKLTTEFTEPYILITNRSISGIADILPVLEAVAKASKPLLVIADEVEGEALHTLIVNKIKGVLASCVVKAPSYGENRTDVLSDIAMVTGGQVIDASSGLSLRNVTLQQLGTCKRVIVSRTNTTIVGNNNKSAKEAVEERIQALRSALNNDLSLDELRRNNYKKRLAKLVGGVAVVKVGGSTEVEILEKKDRVEDALNATVAAVQEGMIPGGGCALYYAGRAVEGLLTDPGCTDDERAGIRVIFNACKSPLCTIVENTGKSAAVVMNNLDQNVEQDNWRLFGYDAVTGKYGNMIEKGIIDPVKVARYALEHAASIVGLMLTCNAVIVNEEE